MQFKSRPHIISAFQFKLKETIYPDWFKKVVEKGGAFITLGNIKNDKPHISVKTKSGLHVAFEGDWVCKNSSGTLFVLSDEELKAGFYV